MEKASEWEWLEFFYKMVDLGPADDDVRYKLKQDFMKKTGKKMPEGYEIED